MTALLDRLATLARSPRPALVAEDGACTYEALLARAGGVAGALVDGGLTPGARVALLCEPGVAWVASFLGVMMSGGVAVPLSPLHPEAEIRALSRDAEPSLSLVGASLAARAAWTGAPALAPEALPPRAFEPRVDERELAMMLYTSGTTGRPKGALLTHTNLSTQAGLLADAWEVTRDDRLLHALPLHHLHGISIALLTALWAEATVELAPRFDRRRIWERLSSATVWMAVPTMYHRLFEDLDAQGADERRSRARAAAGLRLATSGSAALPVGLAERWRELTGAVPLERFGMTEIGVGAANPLRGERRPGTVGVPLPTVSLRVVDEQGGDAAPGEPGEIRVRGPSVFAGYFRRGDATAAAFADGWFCTGDTATLDPAGYVKILGRTSVDILKSGGYKLSALEIEEALRQHPAIADVAVVGVEDPRWGERVVAAVVRRPGSEADLSTQALREFAAARLAPYKLPHEARVVDELPRNALGKVQKPALRAALSLPARG
ncbi:MAG: acyl-CoA synthetase [Polyangiaceae bacterium]|nr:acyl-CoA synthetase [Polyangiaceae bacterium]